MWKLSPTYGFDLRIGRMFVWV